MVDFAMDVHGTLYPDQEVPTSLVDKRAMVVEKFKELQAETDPVLRIFTEPEVTKQIQASRDSKQLLDFLVKGYGFQNRLKTFIDESTFGSNLQTLQQRTWLIHWSLFVFFNHPKGRDLIIDLFLYQKPYLNAIQTTCPWILRYLATAVICNKSSRRNVMKDLIKVIQEESYTYRDPITSFIEDLYVNFDFDGAQQKLRDCETVL